MDHRQTHDIIVAGASSGGLSAFRSLLGQLPESLNAAVFVVQHRHPSSDHLLSDILAGATRMPVMPAEDGAPIEMGKVVVAPPDRHLVLEPGRMRLSRGPRENMARPAVDPLFRSAAVSFGTRTIGVVLTGQLNDGAAGLAAVKRCGGTAVVQRPDDALFPDMPEAAMQATATEHCVPLAELGPLLVRLAGEEAGPPVDVPEEMRLEARMAIFENLTIEVQDRIGDLSGLSCPECHGPLWVMKGDGPLRFRCHVGHAFTVDAALARQNEEVERALWMAFRILADRGAFARRAAMDARRASRFRLEKMWNDRGKEAEHHLRTLQSLLSSPPDEARPAEWPDRTGAREIAPHSHEAVPREEPDPV